MLGSVNHEFQESSDTSWRLNLADLQELLFFSREATLRMGSHGDVDVMDKWGDDT
jgi:hypothetical protein